MNKVKTYAEAREVFNGKGFSFTVGSMRFLMEHKKSFSEVASIGNEESCLYMVAAALPSHSIDEAFDTVYYFMEHGIGISLLHYMLKELAKEQDFFMSTRNLEILEEISQTSDLISSKDLVDMISKEMMDAAKNVQSLT